MFIDAKRRLASAAFVTLLILSIFWPSPVVTINQLCCNAALPIDDLSFLGREAPAWDVVFWCITGIFALALLQDAHDFREIATEFRATQLRIRMMTAVALVGAAIVVALIWIYADSPVTAWSERIAS